MDAWLVRGVLRAAARRVCVDGRSPRWRGCGVLCARDAMRARRWRESCVCLSTCDGCVLVDVGHGRAFACGTSVGSRQRRAPHPTHRQQLPQLLPELLLVGRRSSHGGQRARSKNLLNYIERDAHTHKRKTIHPGHDTWEGSVRPHHRRKESSPSQLQ